MHSHSDKRGASLVGYGLLVGLIGVTGLIAITGVGDSVDEIFVETSDQLGSTMTEAASAGQGASAAAAPSASASPVSVCGSMTLMATAPRTGGGTWGMCRFQRNIAEQLADAQSLAQGCISPSQVDDTAFVTVDFPGVSAGQAIGGLRYEIGTISNNVISQSGSTQRDIYNCTNARCSTSVDTGSDFGVSGNLNSLADMQVCELSLDSVDLTGRRNTGIAPELRLIVLANMGDVGSSSRNIPSPPVIQYASFRPAGGTSTLNTIGAAVVGNVMIRID
ncbi:MAG: hypothetical protein Alpg2KO_31450 [Alphaproteobacteria bacterium]